MTSYGIQKFASASTELIERSVGSAMWLACTKYNTTKKGITLSHVTKEAKKIVEEIIGETDLTDSLMFDNLDEVEKGETILATIEEEFPKRLWTLATFYGKETDLAKVEYKFSKDDKSIMERGKRLSVKEDLLTNLFWFIVKEKFNLWNESGLGLRKNWVIVRTGNNSDMDPHEMLRRLLGR